MLPSNEKLEVGKYMICRNYPNTDNYLSCGIIKEVEGYENISYPQHLYIVSSETIKQEDYIYDEVEDNVHNTKNDVCTIEVLNRLPTIFKVIASTDSVLGLPNITEHFIDDYCYENGIDEVMVEYESGDIIISEIKDTWTREEVIKFAEKYALHIESKNILNRHKAIHNRDWIEENLY